ncbi:hypothetical protein CDAR_127011 [Caerostris darwini]|uniref:Uncharacterized protein n=1 Tax=Caerostris darwini TaxID=1538125 RepID=A0AAV4TF90_9ARAC|nr:hypothetical protein CDAR_127011 [Caerostris darwini]
MQYLIALSVGKRARLDATEPTAISPNSIERLFSTRLTSRKTVGNRQWVNLSFEITLVYSPSSAGIPYLFRIQLYSNANRLLFPQQLSTRQTARFRFLCTANSSKLTAIMDQNYSRAATILDCAAVATPV